MRSTDCRFFTPFSSVQKRCICLATKATYGCNQDRATPVCRARAAMGKFYSNVLPGAQQSIPMLITFLPRQDCTLRHSPLQNRRLRRASDSPLDIGRSSFSAKDRNSNPSSAYHEERRTSVAMVDLPTRYARHVGVGLQIETPLARGGGAAKRAAGQGKDRFSFRRNVGLCSNKQSHCLGVHRAKKPERGSALPVVGRPTGENVSAQ